MAGVIGASSYKQLVCEDSPNVQWPWLFWLIDKICKAWFWFINNGLCYILGASMIISHKDDACNGR